MTAPILRFRWDKGSLVQDDEGQVHLSISEPMMMSIAETYVSYTKILPIPGHRLDIYRYLSSDDPPNKKDCWCPYCKAFAIILQADAEVADG